VAPIGSVTSGASGRRLARLTGLALTGALAAPAVTGCEGRAPRQSSTAETPRAAKASLLDGPVVAEIDLGHGVPEARSTSLFGAPSRRSHIDLVRALRALAEDREGASSPTKGVLVRLGTAEIGLARAQEIGALLGEVRKHKPVVCHADEYANSTLLIAAKGCSRIWVSPAGGVESIGIAAQLLYANSLLQKLHVAVDFLQVGKYKGAEEPYTRDGPSPEARASLESALGGMRAGWLADIAEGRAKPGIADLVEDGPYAPEDARALGIVDAVGYPDDAREDAQKLSGTERTTSRFGGGEGPPGASRGLVGMLRALAGSSQSGTPHVTVVPAVGPISMSSSPSILGGSDGITERELGKLITRLTTDASTKAVVLRIDSPGGSALASDLIWKKLMKLRAKKTLVVSVGGMAASGGYYLSCAGTKIMAEPTSLLGSIGVVGGKLAVGKTLEQIGVHAETIAAAQDPKKAARAAYMSTFTPWDDPTRAKVLVTMKSVYDLFLSRVAEGRGTTVDKIAPSAEGRVYGGLEAKERGMIDAIGGLGDAIDLAIKLEGLPKDTPTEVIDGEGGILDFLEDSSAGGEAASSEAVVAAKAGRVAREAVLPAGLDAALPEAGPFLGALAPLLSGERVVLSLGYGLRIK
jgi:protease-4